MTRRLVAGAVLAVLVGATGCADEAEPAMTKAEYLETGNEICADTVEQLDATIEDDLAPVAGDPGAGVAWVRAEYIPTSRRMIDDLRGLGYPPGDEEVLDDLYDDAEDVLIVVGRDPLSALRTDAANPFAAVDRRLIDYGLTGCGES